MAKTKKGLGQIQSDNDNIMFHPETNVIEVKSEEIKTSEKEVADFIKDPENRKRAINLAFQIQQELPHWFQVPKVVKTFKIDLPEAAKQIEMLMLFKMCVGRVEKGKPLFKIDLDHKEQRRLILESIEQKKGEILFLQEKLAKLN